MFSTYKNNDVTILLKDITGLVAPLPTEEREKRIQSGHHYSEMLPIEYVPSKEYMDIYKYALTSFSKKTAQSVEIVAEKIWKDKKEDTVLVSLARAGISIGVLIKHYLEKRYNCTIPHYAVSIIRDIGIDNNAMNYILNIHKPSQIQFVDGWTGKGVIQKELKKAMSNYHGVSPGLAVLSDPANVAEKYGTQEDFLIPSSCLNSTISGLLSRTFYRKDIIYDKDFHGASFYENLYSMDLTYEFIHMTEKHFFSNSINDSFIQHFETDDLKRICNDFKINDINLVKPSIGETTRVLLRRVPWIILVHSLHDYENLNHIYQLALEKGVRVIEYPLNQYKACGIIRTLSEN